jgi:hypothetical protein
MAQRAEVNMVYTDANMIRMGENGADAMLPFVRSLRFAIFYFLYFAHQPMQNTHNCVPPQTYVGQGFCRRRDCQNCPVTLSCRMSMCVSFLTRTSLLVRRRGKNRFLH